MRRHLLNVLILWVILTLIGFVIANQINPFFIPEASREAREIDHAFRLLMLQAVPVLAFVLAFMGYSIFRFRSSDDPPTEDGPPLRANRGVIIGWLAITTALAIFLIVHPGFTDLFAVWSDTTSDLVVQVHAKQWNWSFTYPQYGVTLRKAEELYLPAGRRVRFEITSEDVIHSFWIPAFRLKQDAVPGLTTVVYVTPDREGEYDPNVNSGYRVQCAELCGTGHARMRTALKVMSPSEFEAQMKQLQAQETNQTTQALAKQ